MPEVPDDPGGNGEHLDGEPAPSEKPPLLDYPGPVTEGDYGETESWAEVGRAIVVVFSVMGLLFFITFGFCGIFAHGCG
jgi:hypothetical protein